MREADGKVAWEVVAKMVWGSGRGSEPGMVGRVASKVVGEVAREMAGQVPRGSGRDAARKDVGEVVGGGGRG